MSSYVFISYCSKDGVEYAAKLYSLLAEQALNPWRDKKQIDGGYEWSKAIDEAIDASYAMVVLMTPEANKSIGVTYEWARAMGMGSEIIKTIAVHFGNKGDVPKQFSPLHWMDYHATDFEYQIVDTLRKFQTEDGLVNIRIPYEADTELRTLAKKAFSINYSRDENILAIRRLADMPEDPIAREILIAGLNKRERSIQSAILNAMIEKGFDDERAIPKLNDFLFLEHSENLKREQERQAIRKTAMQLLANMPKAFDEIGSELVARSSEQMVVINTLDLMSKVDFASTLPYLGKWLMVNDRSFQEIIVSMIKLSISTGAVNSTLKEIFDIHLMPVFADILDNMRMEYTINGNYPVYQTIMDILVIVSTPTSLDLRAKHISR
jgi:hypothetical protein